ncbi:uncharacterized protein K02A2.6-like [Lytechinus pictus]|uniref:uncharacterized protein K02A2.6-like n=1 Tax=Lytechinus pictus TaxID=7653 RepID=UPI0030BA2261
MICSVDSQEHESREEWKVNLIVNNEPVEFKIDTGAQANILPETIYHKLKPKPKLQKAKVKLTGYYETNIPVKGRYYVQMEYKGIKHSVQCLIIPGNRQPLLGLRTSEELYLVKRVYHVDKQTEIKTGKTVVQDYDNVFVGLGCLPGKHHITLKDNAQPVQHACRKVPFPIQKKLKEELDKMENMDVIKQVDEPTDWMSSLVVVKKKNGQLRVCLDPRDLNRAIKREHYKLPSRAEISSQFAGAKYFSKLDASSGFWQIQLDEDSSKLCTFITPYGRYRFLRLPFGICSAPEVFHKIIHNLFVDVPGVNTMMDDIVVWGSTQEEHDDRLRKVLDIAQKSNLKLNRDKCEFNVNQMTFIGDLISQDGVRPDPKKWLPSETWQDQHIDTKSVRGRKDEQKVKQKERFDKHARDLPKLKPGDNVILQDMKTNTWSQRGIIKSVNNHNRSYQIETATGEIRRRNRRHIRPDPRRQAESIPLPTQDDFELDDSTDAEPASDVRASSSSSRTEADESLNRQIV